MSDIQENEPKETDQTLQSALLPALIVWLKVIFYFFVLPFKIWKATTFRLENLAGKSLVSDQEEYPMYTFSKISYDATIFIFGILTILGSLIGLFAVGISGAFSGIVFYFMIPFISLFKEIITISLGVIKRLENIDANTKK